MNADKNLLIRELYKHLKLKFPDDLKDVVLFGSHVSGKEHDDSDFDFLIILKNKPDWKREREISDICYDLDLKYDIITDTLIISEPELSTLRGKQLVFVNAILNGIHA